MRAATIFHALLGPDGKKKGTISPGWISTNALPYRVRVYNSLQSTQFAQSSDCTQFFGIINLCCIQTERQFALSADSADIFGNTAERKTWIAHSWSRFIYSKFVECAPRAGRRLKTQQTEVVSGAEYIGHHFSRKIIGDNRINQKHLLCTSCEFEVHVQVY